MSKDEFVRCFVYGAVAGLAAACVSCVGSFVFNLQGDSAGVISASVDSVPPVVAKSDAAFDLVLDLSEFPPEVVSFTSDGCARVSWLTWAAETDGCLVIESVEPIDGSGDAL